MPTALGTEEPAGATRTSSCLNRAGL